MGGGEIGKKSSVLKLGQSTGDFYNPQFEFELSSGINVSDGGSLLNEPYTELYFPKEYFDENSVVGISKTDDYIKGTPAMRLEGEFYVYRIDYNLTSSGGQIEMPMKIRFKRTSPNMIPNGTVIEIAQKFFSKDANDGSLILHDEQKIAVKVETRLESYDGSGEDWFDIGKVEGRKVTFKGSYGRDRSGNDYMMYGTEPGGRRLYAKVPEKLNAYPSDLNKVGTEWKFDSAKNLYYRDFADRATLTTDLEFDLSTYDFSKYDSRNRTAEFEVAFILKALDKNGDENDAIPSKKWTYTNNIWLEYQSSDSYDFEGNAYVGVSRQVYVDENYQKLKNVDWFESTTDRNPEDWSRRKVTLNFSGLKEELNKKKIWAQIQPMSADLKLNKKAAGAEPIIDLKSSEIKITSYTYAAELQLRLSGVSDEAMKEKFRERLKGTKVFGITKDGAEILITDNLPLVTKNTNVSTENEKVADWYQLPTNLPKFTKIRFDFPQDNGYIQGETEFDLYKTALSANVICEVEENVITKMEEKEKGGEQPRLFSGYASSGSANILSSIIKRVKAADGAISSKTEHKTRLYYGHIFMMNFNAFFHDYYRNYSYPSDYPKFYKNKKNEISVSMGYTHKIYGIKDDSSLYVKPENFKIYYLYPDVLVPQKDSTYYGDSEPDYETEIIYGALEGMNLLIKTPRDLSLVSLPENTTLEKKYYVESQAFDVSGDWTPGVHKVYGGILIDNNKLIAKDGKLSGIRTNDNATEIWRKLLQENIIKHKLSDKNFVVASREETFELKLDKAIFGKTKIKLAEDSQSNFSSSTGDKGKPGMAVDYELSITNYTAQTYNKLSLINVLPRVGDKTLVANKNGEFAPRGSRFMTNLIASVDSNDFDVYYSIDEPLEGAENNYKNASWSSSLPSDLSKITMIRAELKSGKSFDENKTFKLLTHNAIENRNSIRDLETAYNNFAYSIDGGENFFETLKASAVVGYPEKRKEKKPYDISATIKVKPVSDTTGEYVEKYPKKLSPKEKVRYELKLKNTGRNPISTLYLWYNPPHLNDYLLGEYYRKYYGDGSWDETINENRGSKFKAPISNIEENPRFKTEYLLSPEEITEYDTPLDGDWVKDKPSDFSKVKIVTFTLDKKHPLEPEEELVIYTEHFVEKEKDTKDGDVARATFTILQSEVSNRDSNIAEIQISIPTSGADGTEEPSGGESSGGGKKPDGGGNSSANGDQNSEQPTIPDLPVVVAEESLSPLIVEEVNTPVVAELNPETTEIDFDETPRGDADMDFDIEEEEVPKGHKKTEKSLLAKTGGAEVSLFQSLGILMVFVLILAFFYVLKGKKNTV